MKKLFFLFLFVILTAVCSAQAGQLQFYIEHAIQSSPLLNDYRNQVDLNGYDSLLIRAGLRPQVTGSSMNSYAPVIKGWGYDAAITNGGNFASLVGVNQSIPNKRNLHDQFDRISLLNKSISNSAKISEQELKRTVSSQYITAFGSLQQLNMNREVLILLQKEETILKKLTQSNVYKQVDYLSFLVTLQQQDLGVKQLSMQYEYDLAMLNYLSGLSDSTVIELKDPEIILARLPDMSQSVFFKKFEIDSLQLINNKRLLAINYRPRLNLFADAGYTSSLAYKAYKNIGTSFGVSLVVPIYDGNQKRLQFSKIDIEERSRLAYHTFFVGQYNSQILQLTRQLNSTEALIADINNQLKYSGSLIDVNRKLIGTGEARITDYILALNNYINANNLLTQNKISRLQVINQLNYWNL